MPRKQWKASPPRQRTNIKKSVGKQHVDGGRSWKSGVAIGCGSILIGLLYYYYPAILQETDRTAQRAAVSEKDLRMEKGARPIQLTPDWIERLIQSAISEGVDPKWRDPVEETIDKNATIRKARKLVQERKLKEAKFLYRHLLEHDPFDNQTSREIVAIYKQEYPEGPRGNVRKNFTQEFFTVALGRVKEEIFAVDGRDVKIKQVHPNIFVLDNFVSDEECGQLINLHEEVIKNRSSYPLICFQHKQFMKRKSISENVIQGTYCLQPSLSKYVAPHLNWSYSTAVFRKENELVDKLEMRIEKAIGLGHRHARDTQLLSYLEGVSYNDHTDCFYQHKVTDNDKTATVLVYLNDKGLDGGDTVFSRLEVGFRPRKGMAVVFYNFKGDKCDLDMMHRSSVVKRGRKVIFQKWYSYPDAPFFNERVVAPKVQGRRPYQPTVSCDYILGGGESSCRWYENWPFL